MTVRLEGHTLRRALAAFVLVAAAAWGVSVMADSNPAPHALVGGQLIHAGDLNANFEAMVTHRYYAEQPNGAFVDVAFGGSASAESVLTLAVPDAAVGGTLDLHASGLVTGQDTGASSDGDVECIVRWVIEQGGATSDRPSPSLYASMDSAGVSATGAGRAMAQRPVAWNVRRVPVTETPVSVDLTLQIVGAQSIDGSTTEGACRAEAFTAKVVYRPPSDVP